MILKFLQYIWSLGKGLSIFLWDALLLLAPVLLLGLLLSGLIHVFVSRHAFQRWLKKDDLGAIATSAAIGVPIPLCSCSVLPVVAEMRQKGASRSSCISFLITAPETGADSILITNVFFGWVAAVARPLVSFVTAVITGLFCMKWVGADVQSKVNTAGSHTCCTQPEEPTVDEGCCPDHTESHRYLVPAEEDCFINWRRLREALSNSIRSIQKIRPQSRVTPSKGFIRIDSDSSEGIENEPLTVRTIIGHIMSYGFKNVADDILFALLVGLLLGGILYLIFPTELLDHSWAQWLSYPVMMVVSVPLYICASASTPIAAGLVAGGLSPGAGLIFLMSGPATNMATMSVVNSQFGPRFTGIYIGGVMSVTLLCGILVDIVLFLTGFQLTVNLAEEHTHAIQLIQYASLAIFVGLVIWRFRAGAFRTGWNEMTSNFQLVRTYVEDGRKTSQT